MKNYIERGGVLSAETNYESLRQLILVSDQP